MATQKQDRYVLCRSLGGLNDVLSQIGRCYVYAGRFNRHVVVDSNYKNTQFIRDDFSNYFRSLTDRMLLDSNSIKGTMSSLSKYPECVAMNFDDYEFESSRSEPVVEKWSRQLISFDFSKDYNEQLLIHHQFGGCGVFSILAISQLRLQKHILDELVSRLSSIGRPYLSIHIRNTDMTTDYQAQLIVLEKSIRTYAYKDIFVATDNRNCLEFCQKLFSEFNIVSFNKFLRTNGSPLHIFESVDNNHIKRTNINAILDLLMLALADRAIFLKVNNAWRSEYSGFSLLAQRLHGSPSVLMSVIGEGVKHPLVIDAFRRAPKYPEPGRDLGALYGSNDDPKMRRNELCFCGSGQRYKHCHGAAS